MIKGIDFFSGIDLRQQRGCTSIVQVQLPGSPLRPMSSPHGSLLPEEVPVDTVSEYDAEKPAAPMGPARFPMLSPRLPPTVHVVSAGVRRYIVREVECRSEPTDCARGRVGISYISSIPSF